MENIGLFMAYHSAGTPNVSFDLSSLARGVFWASAIVIVLGIFREVFILNFGLETPLKDFRHLGLDSELSLPAVYSAALLLGIGLVCFMVGRAVKNTGGKDSFRWALLGGIFALMAFDEAASFHESLMMPLRNAFDLTGIFYYSWVIPGAIGVVAIGAYFIPFLLRLPLRSAVLFALAGALYVGGALGFEFFGGALEEAVGKDTAIYSVSIIFEEGLEIVGLSIFLWALTDHIARVWGAIGVQFAAAPQAAGRTVRDAAVAPAE